MKKLRLDDLSVESFDTTREPQEERGTVQAHSGIYSCQFCESFNDCSADSCHPYTCSGSYDYTFCGCDTEYDYTCAGQC